MKSIISIIALLFTSNLAFATGSTYCSVDNDEISLEVNLTNGRLFGSPVINGAVSVQIKKNAIAVGITDYEFKVTNGEVPYWFNIGDDLKLGAYAEPETDSDGNPIDFWASISVVVDAKYVEGTGGPSLFVGKYTVTQDSSSVGPGSLTKTFEGEITCEI
ncbi:MAG: hypothetical protein AB8E15_08900 [Bdellovibrionales bacterium]